MDQPEHRLSIHVNTLLERIILEPAWFTAQDTAARGQGTNWEEQAQKRMIWEQKRRKFGVKPAQLDWRLFQAPIYAEFELKFGKGKPSENQLTTMRLLTDRGIPTGCFWSIPELYEFLVGAGFRLHPNAANIVAEIEARHGAAQDLAELKIPKKKASVRRPAPRYLWKAAG